MDCLFDSKFQPLSWLFVPVAKLAGSEKPILDSRISIAICTLGLSEVLKIPEAATRKLISDYKASEYVSKLKNCMIDLLKEQNLKGLIK